MTDVLEVLRYYFGEETNEPEDFRDAIDKVAELIAANEEYDAARIEQGRWLLCELNDAGLAALVRWRNATERRAAALAAVKGE